MLALSYRGALLRLVAMGDRGWNQTVLWSGHGNNKDGDRDDWATPPHIFDPLHAEFEFGLDAAALEHNRKVGNHIGPDHPDPLRRDALSCSWALASGGRPAWCNPTYSIAGRFMAVARNEAKEGGIVSALLVFARTDTRWWWRSVLRRDHKTGERLPGHCAAEIRWHPGRIAFLDPLTGEPRMHKDKNGKERPQSAPAPSVLIVYRPGYTGEWPENGIF